MKVKIGDTFDTKGGSLKILDILSYKEAGDRHKRFKVKFTESGYVTITRLSSIKSGNVTNPYYPTVCGIGYLGEGEFKTSNNGKQTRLYILWHNMIQRCYDARVQHRNPTYIGVEVCKRWLCFQVFASDIVKMPNYNKIEFCLDKDILRAKNKIYAPEFCSFVPQEVNTSIRGLLSGDFSCVTKNVAGDFSVSITNTRGPRAYLGRFKTKVAAIKAAKQYYIAQIQKIASKHKTVLEPKVYNALISLQ